MPNRLQNEQIYALKLRLDDLHGDQRRMGGGNDLSQRKGALKGTMDRYEFTDEPHALSNNASTNWVTNCVGRIKFTHYFCVRLPHSDIAATWD